MENNIDRRAIFGEEMDKLRQAGLISDDDYERIRIAYFTYQLRGQRAQQPQESMNNTVATQSQTVMNPVMQRVQSTAKSKMLTPEEAREKRITWILILGVIMVLLSGLILATSNWDVMSDITKTILIGFVGILFFGVSILAEKTLKIKKTAYAFWILGSLFLPVVILSAGFFELLGQWLSVYGDGRYVLGVLGAGICIPVYTYSAYRYKSRLFAWLSLTALSIGVCYLIAAFYPTSDWFFFTITVYNSILVVGHMKLKDSTKLSIIKGELPVFIQVNLIISTLFMLIIFDNYSFYGFNIILTAILFCLLLFYHGRVEYSFVFSGLLVYGIYQIIQNTFLVAIDILFFALIGFIFLPFESFLKQESKLAKIFQYISGFFSFMAFVYISLQGTLFEVNDRFLLMSLSYLAISFNTGYLAYKSKQRLFSYFTPVFLLFAGRYLYYPMSHIGKYYTYGIHMYGLALGLFYILYHRNKWKITRIIRESSGVVSLLAMLYAIFHTISAKDWIAAFLMFVVYGIVLYLIYKVSERFIVRMICRWAMPLAWFLGIVTLYGAIEPNTINNGNTYNLAIHLGVANIIVFLLGIVWKRIDENLQKAFMWLSNGLTLFITPMIFLLYALGGYRFPYVYLGFLGMFIYSLLTAMKEWAKKVFLYSAFTMLPITLLIIFRSVPLKDNWESYVFMITSILISTLWYVSDKDWKKRIVWYLIPFSLIGASMFVESPGYGWLEFFMLVVYLGLILYINHQSRLQIINVIPLAMLLTNIRVLRFSIPGIDEMAMLTIWISAAIILRALGQFLSRKLYYFPQKGRDILDIDVDWYSLISLISIFNAMESIPPNSGLLISTIPHVLVSICFILQINRVDGKIPRKVVLTLTLFSFLIPYYRLVDQVNIPEIIYTETICFPWLVLAIGLSRKVWVEGYRLMNKLELGVLLVISAVLFRDIMVSGDIYEGLIMGGLSLIAIVVGMQQRTKSYFFVGIGDLLLNVLFQTRAFWQSIPWWIYLLGAGLILIVVASIAEMQKNKGSKKPVKLGLKNILAKFRDWE